MKVAIFFTSVQIYSMSHGIGIYVWYILYSTWYRTLLLYDCTQIRRSGKWRLHFKKKIANFFDYRTFTCRWLRMNPDVTGYGPYMLKSIFQTYVDRYCTSCSVRTHFFRDLSFYLSFLVVSSLTAFRWVRRTLHGLSDPQRSSTGAKECEIHHKEIHHLFWNERNSPKWPRADLSMMAANSSSGIEEVIPMNDGFSQQSSPDRQKW
jgi:hypothetical protein